MSQFRDRNHTSPELDVDGVVILVNWNGTRDTIECVESLVCGKVVPRMVVVDNNSRRSERVRLRDYLTTLEPFVCEVLQPDEQSRSTTFPAQATRRGADLLLIESPENLGFARGNNLGIRHAKARWEPIYYWLLNNDCVVEPEAYSAMVSEMNQDIQCCSVGSIVLDYGNSPATIQCIGGGDYYWMLGASKLLGKGVPLADLGDEAPAPPGYVMGVSWLIRGAALEQAGLLDPIFIMYTEEVDWQLRAREAVGCSSARVARRSVVWHKGPNRTLPSASFYYHLARSSTILNRRHWGFFHALIGSVGHFLMATRWATWRFWMLRSTIAGLIHGWSSSLDVDIPSLGMDLP